MKVLLLVAEVTTVLCAGAVCRTVNQWVPGSTSSRGRMFLRQWDDLRCAPRCACAQVPTLVFLDTARILHLPTRSSTVQWQQCSYGALLGCEDLAVLCRILQDRRRMSQMACMLIWQPAACQGKHCNSRTGLLRFSQLIANQ